MRAARRSDKTSPAHEVPLRDCNDFHVKMITVREAREMAASGSARLDMVWRHGKHAAGEVVGVRLSGPRSPGQRPIIPITRGEADAVAGAHMLCGASRTMRMSDARKELRVERIREDARRIVPHEDFTERALGKMAFYPVATYDPKNPATVGPRVDAALLAQFVEMPSAL